MRIFLDIMPLEMHSLVMETDQVRNKLRQLIDARGVSMRALSLRAGLKHNAVANMLSRTQKLNYGSLEKVLRALDVAIVDFWESDSPAQPPAMMPPPGTSIAPVPGRQSVFVPDCGLVSAGAFRLPDPDVTPHFLAGTREDEGSFVLTIRGDSMMPEYQDGEIIFLRRENIHLIPLPDGVRVGVPFERVSHLHGKDCVVLLKDEGSTFKRIQLERSRGPEYTVTLLPVNPDHNKTVIRPDHDVWIQGVCYKSVRKR